MSEWKETDFGTIPDDWELFTVAELVKRGFLFAPKDGNHGNIHPKTADFVRDGIPFIMASDMKDGKVDFLNCAFITYEQSKRLQKGFSLNGDVLLSHKATIGRTAIVDFSYEYIILTPQVTYYRIKNKEKVNSAYLKYYFDSIFFQSILKSYAGSGSTRDYIGITQQLDLPIILPELLEQQSIAAILSSLDNKIDLLRRQNQTLEQLAQTIFKQWFVNSENEGWKTAKFSDYAFINQRTVDKNYPYQEIEYLDTGSITEGTIESFQSLSLNDAPSRAQRLVQKNDIVYSLVRPIQKHYGILKEVKPNTVVSTGFAVITCNGIDPHFIYLLLTQDRQTGYFESVANNSTSTYPSLKPSDISNLEFKVPPKDLLNRFSGFASSSWDKISLNQKEIQTLTQLRDSLLPRLMSGRLRVG